MLITDNPFVWDSAKNQITRDRCVLQFCNLQIVVI